MHNIAAKARRLLPALFLVLLLLAAAPASPRAAALENRSGIALLDFDTDQILSIGNQTAGKCSLYALRYARTILDGAVSSGAGLWSNGAVWSAAGYTAFSSGLDGCLGKLYAELSAGRPVIVHLQNTYVSGASKHANRTSTEEYHLNGAGWQPVNYPHISTSSTYGHWVCVVGVDAAADPADLEENDFFALDPARVSAGGTLALTRLLNGTIWTENSPLKVLG